MSADNTGTNDQGGVAALGVEAAKEMVGFAAKMIDELLAGVETVAHRGNQLAGSAVQTASSTVRGGTRTVSATVGAPSNGSTSGGSTSSGSTSGGSASNGTSSLVDSRVVSQLFDLAQEVLKVAGDAAGRVLQTGLGPIEKMLDRDSHRHDHVWVGVGEVPAGKSGTATFELENSDQAPAEVNLTVINPPASMKGTIPVSGITFAPAKVQLPGATDDGPGVASVAVTIAVPAGTPAGQYLCIVRSPEVADLTIVLGVDVT